MCLIKIYWNGYLWVSLFSDKPWQTNILLWSPGLPWGDCHQDARLFWSPPREAAAVLRETVVCAASAWRNDRVDCLGDWGANFGTMPLCFLGTQTCWWKVGTWRIMMWIVSQFVWKTARSYFGRSKKRVKDMQERKSPSMSSGFAAPYGLPMGWRPLTVANQFRVVQLRWNVLSCVFIPKITCLWNQFTGSLSRKRIFWDNDALSAAQISASGHSVFIKQVYPTSSEQCSKAELSSLLVG